MPLEEGEDGHLAAPSLQGARELDGRKLGARSYHELMIGE
jgi:hypothetical protein